MVTLEEAKVKFMINFVRPQEGIETNSQQQILSSNHPIALLVERNDSTPSPKCHCEPSAQWESAVQQTREAARELIDTRDTKGGWDLLATLFELPFFELLGVQAPHSLLVHRATAEGREATARQRRSLADLLSAQ